jgi:ATP-dependent RNA helicase SUPV3L1/SUV3
MSSSVRDLDSPPTLTAALGPTNTGKTWRAIQRMLAHPTGMIGLPLRLLAREVYDRCVDRVGAHKVALVTGEEKLVPPSPRYWVCTTESMPVSVPVDFMGIDEVQLAAHPERGHVFTDRLMRARGHRETWFMGSDTMAPLVQRLVPTATVERAERRSQLRHTGPCRLAALPPRSAVVAFSAAHVYELAEQLRVRRGGAAVVLGALSPRTRNKQVELYQSGEVEFLVATDAIGMGLNMDVDHVAFAALSKFDGQGLRALDSAELAQIAGRAGRDRRDGSFGTLAEAPELGAEVVDEIEHHRFPVVKRIWWRNPELDLSGLHALQQSLRKGPALRNLMPIKSADDSDALDKLARRPDIRARCDSPERVALLWEVCCVPDFRHNLQEVHVQLLAQVFLQLTGKNARLSPDWMKEQVDRLDRPDGDLDQLLQRIAHIRTWTYITHRSDWVPDAAAWQARTREVEDKLSDALHDLLTARFVDARAATFARERTLGRALEAELAPTGEVTALGHALGRLDGFDFEVAPGSSKADDAAARSAARVALAEAVADRVQRLLDSADAAFSFDADGAITWEGAPLGRLDKGEELLRPGVRLFHHELLDGHARGKVHERLIAFARAWVEGLFAPLRKVDDEHLLPPARAIRYALETGLGTASRRAVQAHVKALSPMDRRNLARMDVRLGLYAVYVDSLLKPDRVMARALLWTAHQGLDRLPPLPPEGALSLPLELGFDWYRAIGYLPVGPRALRADQVERLLALLRQGTHEGPFELPGAAPSWFGASRAELLDMVRALDFPVDPEGRVHPRRGPRRTRR